MSNELGKRLDRVYGATGQDDLERAYDDWAGSYDEEVNRLGYLLRGVSTGYIGRYIPTEGRILDAGAGTGLIGSYLQIMGYRDLTAIDLSTGMLERARARGCYRAAHRMVLGERLAFESNAFEHGYAVGVFTEGHAPPEAFDEIVRVIEPGGKFVFSIRDDVYRTRGFREKQTALEHSGAWKRITTSPQFQPYPDAKPEILSCVFAYEITSVT